MAQTKKADVPLENSARPTISPAKRNDSVDADAVLQAVGEAVYEWTLDDDVLRWSNNAADLLRVAGADDIATGRRFAAQLDPKSPSNPYDVIVGSDRRDTGDGVRYCVQYCLKTAAAESSSLWIEDSGVWYGDESGMPVRARGTVRAINKRRADEQRLEHLSTRDELTGLLNRVTLLDSLRLAIGEARAEHKTCSFLVVRIDNLAVVNDTYGYEVADHVIISIAQLMANELRGGDSIGRLSGNKFGIVLRKCDEAAMQIAAERLLHTIHEDVVTTDLGPVSVTISLGGVASPIHASTETQALTRAHEVLDQLRRRSNAFAIYRPSEKRAEGRRNNIRLADAIVCGLNEHKFKFAFQPIVSAATNKPAYHECLLRLYDGGMNAAGGGALVGAAERLGVDPAD